MTQAKTIHERIADSISVTNEPTEKLSWESRQDGIEGVKITFDSMPQIYGQETEQIHRWGFRITGVITDSDGNVTVYIERNQ